MVIDRYERVVDEIRVGALRSQNRCAVRVGVGLSGSGRGIVSARGWV